MLLILLIGELLVLFVAEGIFQLGLMIVFLWWLYTNYGEDKSRLLLIQIVTLIIGLIASVLTGTVFGGLSFLWLLGLTIFRLFDLFFSGVKLVWILPTIVLLSYLGDRVLGLRWSFVELLVVALAGLVSIVVSQTNRSIRLKDLSL